MGAKNKRYKASDKKYLGVKKGNKLSELLGKPVYRVCDNNGDRSYMSLFDNIVIPFKVTKHGVYVMKWWLSFGIKSEVEFELVKDECGWADITPLLEETLEVQEELLVSYTSSKATVFDNKSRQVQEILMNAGYDTKRLV